MELDKMKDIWKSGNTPNDQNFDKKKVMKNIENRIKTLQLHDKRKNTSLIMGLVSVLIFCLGLFLSSTKGEDWNMEITFLVFGIYAPFFFYQYIRFSTTPLHNQPTPIFIDHVLKRIKTHRISNWGTIILFILLLVYTISQTPPTETYKAWTFGKIIATITFTVFVVAILGSVFWYQKKYQVGSFKKLEKDLKKLSNEWEEE